MAQRLTTADLERPGPIAAVGRTDERLVADLKDGRTNSVPHWWYPRLLNAIPEQRASLEIGRFGIHWPQMDDDLTSPACSSAAKPPAPPHRSETRGLRRPGKP